jgi:hypothetical protein
MHDADRHMARSRLASGYRDLTILNPTIFNEMMALRHA